MSDYNTQIIEEFRANAGKVAAFGGAPLVLITTIGAKSGQSRTAPVVYLPDGDRMVIFASKAGAPTNPDWYHNLKANPRVTVETGSDTFQAIAEEVTGAERDRLFAAQVAAIPRFQEYADSTTRVIPAITITRAG